MPKVVGQTIPLDLTVWANQVIQPVGASLQSAAHLRSADSLTSYRKPSLWLPYRAQREATADWWADREGLVPGSQAARDLRGRILADIDYASFPAERWISSAPSLARIEQYTAITADDTYPWLPNHQGIADPPLYTTYAKPATNWPAPTPPTQSTATSPGWEVGAIGTSVGDLWWRQARFVMPLPASISITNQYPIWLRAAITLSLSASNRPHKLWGQYALGIRWATSILSPEDNQRDPVQYIARRYRQPWLALPNASPWAQSLNLTRCWPLSFRQWPGGTSTANYIECAISCIPPHSRYIRRNSAAMALWYATCQVHTPAIL